METFTDGQLIREYRCKDSQKAFEILITRYTLQLQRMIYLKISDPDDRKDLFQSLMLCLAEKLKTCYEERGLFVPWLQKVATNAINAYFRQRYTNPFILIEDVEYAAQEMGSIMNVDEAFEDELLKDLLYKVLYYEFYLLKDELKELLCMIHKDQLTFRAIGERRNISFTAVYKQYKRCCRHLKSKMDRIIQAPIPQQAFDKYYPAEMPIPCKWTKYFFDIED